MLGHRMPGRPSPVHRTIAEAWLQRNHSAESSNACCAFSRTHPLGNFKVSGYRCCVRQAGNDPRTLEQRSGPVAPVTCQCLARARDLLHDHFDENLAGILTRGQTREATYNDQVQIAISAVTIPGTADDSCIEHPIWALR